MKQYILTTVKNTSLDTIAMHTQRGKLKTVINVEELQLSETSVSTMEVFENKQLINHVQHAVQALPDSMKMIFRMKLILGMSNREIAKRTGLSPNSINQYIRRARKLIQIKIQEEVDAE